MQDATDRWLWTMAFLLIAAILVFYLIVSLPDDMSIPPNSNYFYYNNMISQ